MKTKERGNARGFTLVELVIVLAVLAALAGILLPQFSGIVNRTHTAVSSTNISELGKAFALYNVKTLKGYPDQYDSLIDVTAGAAPTVNGISTLPFDASASNTDIAIKALDAGQLKSLNQDGIRNICPMNATLAPGNSATFDAAGDPIPIDTTQKYVFLTNAKVKAAFGIDGVLQNEEYVCFGVGSQCTAIGTVMQEAPLHFDQTDPAVTYERFVVVYAVPAMRTAATKAFNARLVGFLGTELNSLGNEINEYYSKSSQ